MKKTIIYLTCFFLFGSLTAQETTVLRFSDKFQPSVSGQQAVVKLVSPKTKRLKSSLGCLIGARYASDLSEEMKFCIKSATELWASNLSIRDSIVLVFKKEHLGAQNADYTTNVYYTPGAALGNTTYPFSYAVNIGIAERNKEQSFDAEIIINADANWEFGFTNESKPGQKNFTTAMLRSIGIALGFGSTVYYNSIKGGILFTHPRYFSPFDNGIINSNNVYLNTMPNNLRADERLTSYVTGNNVYLKYPNNSDYKLYAPKNFDDFRSLKFYETKGSLMSYGLKNGDKILEIDERTLEGIRTVGWKVQSSDINIKGEGIAETGIVSSYQPYRFYAENNIGTPITAYTWKYELLNKKKQYVTKKTGNSSTFTIDAVDNVILYDRNLDGDIQGRITLEADIQGRKIKKLFSLYLETKPSFITVKIDKITPRPDGNFYDLDVTAIYTGTDYLHYNLEEEFSFEGRTKYIYEPYIAHLHFDALYMEGVVFLDIDINNAYGKVVHSIEIPNQKNLSGGITIINPHKDLLINKYDYEILNIQGQFIKRTANYSDIKALPSGVYIIKSTNTDGQSEIQKTFIK